MTTRKYYRNSILAFPKTSIYAASITRYKPKVNRDSVVMYVSGIAFVFLIVLLVTEKLK
jgi:hypothetical protein